MVQNCPRPVDRPGADTTRRAGRMPAYAPRSNGSEDDMDIQLTSSERELLDMARSALGNAYAPYSHYRVGACILSRDGAHYCGCNVENASFGLTLCAERGAVMAAVAAGARDFERIAICSEGSMPWPCGACRQVLREFAPDMEVLVEDGQGHVQRASLNELLPLSFGPDSL